MNYNDIHAVLMRLASDAIKLANQTDQGLVTEVEAVIRLMDIVDMATIKIVEGA